MKKKDTPYKNIPKITRRDNLPLLRGMFIRPRLIKRDEQAIPKN
jgi:hypothetical protein